MNMVMLALYKDIQEMQGRNQAQFLEVDKYYSAISLEIFLRWLQNALMLDGNNVSIFFKNLSRQCPLKMMFDKYLKPRRH